jgi:RNA polymerase-binding transcription factor DksA
MATKKKTTAAKKVVKKAAPAKKVVKKAAPAKKTTAAKKVVKKAVPAKKVVKKAAPAKKVVKKAAPAKKVVKKAAPAKKVAPVKKAVPAKKVAPVKAVAPAPVVAAPAPLPAKKVVKKPEPPKRPVIVKGPSQDGITSSKDFDLKFLLAQREALQTERIKLVGQANRLENEANAMIADAEMGDVKFDDEGGEGDTMVVEREQDLVLSAAARQTVEEIDAALARMKTGEYGYSVVSVLPIPKERLRAIPWATELVTERAGGLGRR